MSKKILIYGAGAIGRGYIPWLFKEKNFDLYYVESNNILRQKLKSKKTFKTYMTTETGYISHDTNIKECFFPGEELSTKFDGAITAVGPRQIFELKDNLKKLNCPIIFFENDSTIPNKFSKIIKSNNFFFGIPDVITSNTAPKILLNEDELAIVTEKGEAYADISAREMGGHIKFINQDELKKQWIAKLYIHNTPHCIAAYLGSFCNFKYVHEAMNKNHIYNIVENSMIEMAEAIIKVFGLGSNFVEWYKSKELKRFSNKFLYDPISRVAREPFRKLALTNRLIGAAQLCLRAGVIPKSIITGIMAAFLYDDHLDHDSNIKILFSSLPPIDFLSLIINIQPNEALYELILSNWNINIEKLNDIKNGR